MLAKGLNKDKIQAVPGNRERGQIRHDITRCNNRGELVSELTERIFTFYVEQH